MILKFLKQKVELKVNALTINTMFLEYVVPALTGNFSG